MEMTQSPQTFVAQETVVEKMEYATAVCAPEAILHAMPSKYTLVPDDTSQVKLDPFTQISTCSDPKPTTLPKLIVCPCCNDKMTPKHECKNESLSKNEKNDNPHTPVHAPCPVELTTDPPDSSEGWDRLMNDSDFHNRFADYTKTSDDCKMQ